MYIVLRVHTVDGVAWSGAKHGVVLFRPRHLARRQGQDQDRGVGYVEDGGHRAGRSGRDDLRSRMLPYLWSTLSTSIPDKRRDIYMFAQERQKKARRHRGGEKRLKGKKTKPWKILVALNRPNTTRLDSTHA